jgi:GTP cyclohydrolase I
MHTIEETALKSALERPKTTISEDALMVKRKLISLGLETPLIETNTSQNQKYMRIKSLMQDVLGTLGLDLRDDSLCETPHRIAKMYVNEVFSGLDYHNFPKLSIIDNKMAMDEMVKVNEISLTSTCEHHFITIDGHAKVAYIPEDKIIGLSKINRLVRFFSQRPQVQERLTQQILVALQTLLGTENVAVSISATHFCVKARGVMDSNSYTDTTALGGIFKTNVHTRAEFLS